MNTDQILTGMAIIVLLAVGCQAVAPRLRIPALMLLLPIGFIAGIVFTDVDPIGIFGSAFTPLVNIAVALILFHGGLELAEERLLGKDRKIIQRLVMIGALITWVATALAAYWLLDISSQLALLLGSIVIVSGPTVVGPLLNFVSPEIRIRRILAWEGTLIDPVGALIAVIVFEGVQASTNEPSLSRIGVKFATGIGIGLLGAIVGLALIWVGMRIVGDSRVLGTEVLVGAVVAAASLTDAIADDAGLVTAVVMGGIAPWLIKDRVRELKPFFDTIVSFSVGVLFISISALVTPESLQARVLPCLVIVLILVLIVRPGIALLMTYRTTLSMRERLFIGWMAPRGIVAAATASSFSTALIAAGVPGSDALLPCVFLIIVGTVFIYSATAVLAATILGVRVPPETPAELANVGVPEEA